MIKPQIIESDGRPAFVVLPIAEWRRIEEILEDAADDAALEDWRRNPAETFPTTVADALIDGEDPVRVFRRHRGLTQTALAGQAGISAPYLAQIEAGKRKPGITVMKNLAAALNIPIDALIP
jgi:DNA-binding XRE family transcriptional regulator